LAAAVGAEADAAAARGRRELVVSRRGHGASSKDGPRVTGVSFGKSTAVVKKRDHEIRGNALGPRGEAPATTSTATAVTASAVCRRATPCSGRRGAAGGARRPRP